MNFFKIKIKIQIINKIDYFTKPLTTGVIDIASTIRVLNKFVALNYFTNNSSGTLTSASSFVLTFLSSLRDSFVQLILFDPHLKCGHLFKSSHYSKVYRKYLNSSKTKTDPWRTRSKPNSLRMVLRPGCPDHPPPGSLTSNSRAS